MTRLTPNVRTCVFVERITNAAQEYGYLVAVYGPFPSVDAAQRWIADTLRPRHPEFTSGKDYWIGLRPLRDPADRAKLPERA